MTDGPMSRRMGTLIANIQPLITFFTRSAYARHAGDPNISDFAAGNPQELALPGFVEALQRWSVPEDKNWYAYTENLPAARAAVAESLGRSRGQPFEAEDVFLTNGAFAALVVAMNAVVDPGDEVIYISPPWFFYASLIAAAGAAPVRVRMNPETFDLDLEAIERAITPRTRAIIINSPNNPTGKIYPADTLRGLADLLSQAGTRNGRTIYLLSDEAYSRILFDGRAYLSPTSFYPHSFLIYTYGKTLLTPGERLGYIAMPPIMPERADLRAPLFMAQLLTGYAVPGSVLQHALADLDRLSIDIPHLQHKRDWMVRALREMGYELHVPEGTFYLLPRSPMGDDVAFIELLAEYDVFCLPGITVEMPGYFRISLTANDQMIERALPGFAAARERALKNPA